MKKLQAAIRVLQSHVKGLAERIDPENIHLRPLVDELSTLQTQINELEHIVNMAVERERASEDASSNEHLLRALFTMAQRARDRKEAP